MKKLVSLFLMMLLVNAFAAYNVGDFVSDFSWQDSDGTNTVDRSLHDLINDGKVVMIFFGGQGWGGCTAEAPLLEGVWQDYKDGGNVHIVNANNITDWATLNGSGWRTNFTPNLTYWLSIKSELYTPQYGAFGNGYVPYNIVVGGKYKLLFSDSGFDEAGVRAAIDAGIESLDFDVYALRTLEDLRIGFGNSEQVDLTDLFASVSGATITVEAESADPDIASVSLDGNTLTVTAGDTGGFVNITVRGVAGDYSDEVVFTVEARDPAIQPVVEYDFEDGAQGWTVGGAPTGWSHGLSTALGGNDTNYIGIDSDAAGQGAHCVDTAYSPEIDLSNIVSGTGNIIFKYGFKIYQAGEIMQVHYRVSPSDDWVMLQNLPESDSFTELVIPVPDEMLVETAQIGFLYDDNSNWGWYGGFDDVIIEGVDETSIGDENLAENIELYQNYPNPFNPSTTIKFNLKNDTNVKLTVMNAKGELVKEIVNGSLAAGAHKINFNADSYNSGIYFYKLEANGISKTKKMLLVK